MKHTIPKHMRKGKFLKMKSLFLVPQLVNQRDQYTCKKVLVDGLGIEKRMYWCSHRVYGKRSADEIHLEGFFASSVGKDTAILFRPPRPSSEAVRPYLQVNNVDLLTEKAGVEVDKVDSLPEQTGSDVD